MSALRKFLLAVLLVSLTGSAFGAGTFASFTATTSNAATFASGTLVLSNTNPVNTACLSAGGVGGTTVSSTNAFSCGAAFALATKKPGESSAANITIQNKGSLGAAQLYLTRSGACTDANATVANGSSTNEVFFGTGSMCSNVQLFVQETASAGGAATVCQYGKGASGVANGGAAIVFPLTLTSGDNQLTLTVDGAAHPDVTIPAAAYPDVTSLVTAVNLVIGAYATAAIDGAGVLWISSNTIKGSSAITVAAGTNSALTPLGLVSGTANTVTLSNTGNQAACAYDSVHTLAHFTTNYTTAGAGGAVTTALNLGSLTATCTSCSDSDTNFYTLGVQLPTSAGNDVQGRMATAGFTWTEVQ